MQKRSAHTASFLQTFHTGQTTAARREAVGAEGSEPKAAPADAAAVQFVKTGKSAKFADFTGGTNYVAEYQGIKVAHGEGLITEAQAKYVVSIALGREGVTDAMLDSLKERLAQGLAKYAASQFISTYKDLPRKATPVTSVDPGKTTTAPATTEPTEDGIYVDRATGRIFKLQFNKAQGTGTNLYAKQLTITLWHEGGSVTEHSEGLLDLDVTGLTKDDIQKSWEYRRGLIRDIKPEWRLTPESAKAWGALYGSCIRCHRDLTKEESIGRMMGDICAAKQGF